MKKLILLFTLLFSGVVQLMAQDFDLKWSNKMIYDNYKDGFFQYFAGSTDKLVFGVHKNLALRQKKADSKINIVAFNKSTLAKVGTIELKDKKDKARSEKLRGYSMMDVIVMNSSIQVYWIKRDKGSITVLAESFDHYLNRDTKLSKIYSTKSSETKSSQFSSSRTSVYSDILYSKKSGEQVVLTIPVVNNSTITFNYIVLNQEFKEIASGKVDLEDFENARINYQLGADGNIYINANFSYTRREIKKNSELQNHSKIVVIDPSTNNFETFNLKYDNKVINSLKLKADNDLVRVYGFFIDKAKDPKGRKPNGIFYTTLKQKNNNIEISEANFSYFDKELFDQMFNRGNNENDKSSKKSKKSKSKPKDDEDALDEMYVIEDAVSVDNDIVLVCSKMYNYAVTTCTATQGGGQTCTTRYYCAKSNVTSFRVNIKGEIVWAKNANRSFVFSGWDVYDLRVVSTNDDFYVIYSNRISDELTSKGKKKTKNKNEVRDRFEYLRFDLKSGDYTKGEFVVNEEKTPRKDRKYVNPYSLRVIDNQYFVNSQRVRMKPGMTAAGCVASVACFPVIYWVSMSGDFRKADGYVGYLKLDD
jgi:hypothetical protein